MLKSHDITTGRGAWLPRNLDVLSQEGEHKNSLFIQHLKCRTPLCTKYAFTNYTFMLLEESTRYL